MHRPVTRLHRVCAQPSAAPGRRAPPAPSAPGELAPAPLLLHTHQLPPTQPAHTCCFTNCCCAAACGTPMNATLHAMLHERVTLVLLKRAVFNFIVLLKAWCTSTHTHLLGHDRATQIHHLCLEDAPPKSSDRGWLALLGLKQYQKALYANKLLHGDGGNDHDGNSTTDQTGQQPDADEVACLRMTGLSMGHRTI